MDVRCEKCQTEYELDEARLKPGGVTVKCTNCGHMFKIRKRSTTNVGQPAVGAVPAPPMTSASAVTERGRPSSSKQPVRAAAAPVSENDKETVVGPVTDADSGPSGERQWLIRLENGETKSCRELATLQQWIVAGVATRESLISRSGKTWKRLGDIAELMSYFTIADEARATRTERSTKPPKTDDKKPAGATSKPTEDTKPGAPVPAPGEGRKPDEPRAPVKAAKSPTMMGIGAIASAAGGTILPDDDDPPVAQRRGVSVPPPMPHARTPAMGAPIVPPRTIGMTTPAAVPPAPTLGNAPTMLSGTPVQQTELATGPAVARRPATQPPPPPAGKRSGAGSQSGPLPPLPPTGNRATAGWANDAVRAISGDEGESTSRPFSGKIASIPEGPAFASGKLGTVRAKPGDDAVFSTGKVATFDDDDDVMPVRRGSSAGKWIAFGGLLVMVAVAAVIYVVVVRPHPKEAGLTPIDATLKVAVADAASIEPAAAIDALVAVVPSTETAGAELDADVEPRLRTAMASLDGKDDGPSLAMRARLAAAIAQDLQDRAGLLADKTEAETLRRDAKQLVLDAASVAQRALKAAADDASANLAMADVLRLQGKSAKEVRRYLDTARAKVGTDKPLARAIALADALVLARDGKLADAQTAFAAIDRGDDALDKSGDVRARFHQALALAALGKAVDAKPLVDAILAAQPDHAAARALGAKLATTVATSDPMPNEDGHDAGVATHPGIGSAGDHPGSAGVPVTNPGTNPVTSPGIGADAGVHDPGHVVVDPGDVGGGDYDKLVTKANQLAESNCEAAVKIFQKALEQKPNGVEALTGMGYCHIDAKQFASAFSNFRAALAVSPHNERALWGMAEGYQQQGRKDQAIESYKVYLETYPESAAAKKQLERLGVDAGGGGTPPPGPGSATAPTAPPPVTPPPATPPPATPPTTTPVTSPGDSPVTSP